MRYRFCWKNNAKRLTLFNRTCRIIARGTKNSVCIEFTDNGQREIVSRYALRKIDPELPTADCRLPSRSSNNRQIRFSSQLIAHSF